VAKASRHKASAASAEPTAEPGEDKKRNSRSNLIGGRGYRAPVVDHDEPEPTLEEVSLAVASEPSPPDPPVTMTGLRPLRMDIQQLRQRAERSESRIDTLHNSQETYQSQLEDLEERLAALHLLVQRIEEPKLLPEPNQEMDRCRELEQRLLELTASLELKDQNVADYAETVKSRDDELAELSMFADGLEAQNIELKALLDAQSHSRVQEQLLRDEVVRLQAQLAEQTRKTSEVQPAPEVTDVARSLALAHGLLDEVDILLDGLQPEPPDLVLPLQRLRRRLSDLRGGAAQFRVAVGTLPEGYERLLKPAEELRLTRQRLLEAHTRIEELERGR
jgi:DNA repair exonuclease SbcCD ATPase subunit